MGLLAAEKRVIIETQLQITWLPACGKLLLIGREPNFDLIRLEVIDKKSSQYFEKNILLSLQSGFLKSEKTAIPLTLVMEIIISCVIDDFGAKKYDVFSSGKPIA